MTTLIDVGGIERISREESVGLARTAYERYLDQLRSLSPEDWFRRTDCPDWDVRAMAVHVLGACRGCASIRELVHQVRAGRRWAAEHGRPEIDGINAVQIEDRRHLTPPQIVDELGSAIEPAVRGRARVPGLVRRVNVGDGSGGPMTLGALMEVAYTRDTWMHRIDTARATGLTRELELTPAHDGRVVEDVVAEWAALHGRPFTLRLTGPAGGSFRRDGDGPHLEMDAVEFLRVLSGRPSDGLPAGNGVRELLDHHLVF